MNELKDKREERREKKKDDWKGERERVGPRALHVSGSLLGAVTMPCSQGIIPLLLAIECRDVRR